MRFYANSDWRSWNARLKSPFFTATLRGRRRIPSKRSLWHGNFLRLTVGYLPEITAERCEDAAHWYGLFLRFLLFSPLFPLSPISYFLFLFFFLSLPLIKTPLSTLMSMRRWQKQRSLTDLNVFVLIPTPLMRCFRRQRAIGREGGMGGADWNWNSLFSQRQVYRE